MCDISHAHRGLSSSRLPAPTSRGLSSSPAGLCREILEDPVAVAGALKVLPVPLEGMRPIAEAISSAGGLRLEALDAGLQLREMPGVWACGEMLDWDAPTGGYLLTACFATGRWAGMGVRGALGVDVGSGGA